MNIIAHPCPDRPRQIPVMETFMNIFNPLKRAAKSLLGVGVCLALSAGAASAAQHGTTLKQLFNLPGGGGGGGGATEITFSKVGEQLDCDFVEYRLRFSITQAPGFWDQVGLQAQLDALPFDFLDQLPNGLKAVNVTVTGDITDAVGGAVLPTIETSVNPDDTVKITDFRFSAADLDGDGSNTTRSFYVTIQAQIDPAVFPAAVLVANQAKVTVTRPGGAFIVPSHDPALPDDGDPTTGDPTKILIDVEDCLPPPPPPPPPGDGPCFVLEEGEIECDPLGGGVFIYKMPVGPEMAGETIELVALNPGIVIAPASQVVPAGGGVLIWTITGANPGDTIQLLVTGIKEVGEFDASGLGLCCTQRIDIEIPEDINCPKEEEEEPDLEVKKRADEAFCDLAGICDFTIEVRNVGPVPYTGKIVLDEITTPGNAPVTAGPNAPWVCNPMVTPMSCEYPQTTLNPGEFVTLKLGFTPGPAWAWDKIKNCAKLDYDGIGKAPFGDPTNDKACATIDICLPGDPNCTPPPVDENPDIGVRKMLLEDCRQDGRCAWRITLYNPGPVAINSPVTVVDNFPFDDVDNAIFSPMPPWACGALDGNTFQCVHPGLNLPVGATTDIFVRSFDNPADYPDGKIRNCAEVKPLIGENNLGNNKFCANGEFPRNPNDRAVLEIRKVCQAVTVAGAGIPCRIEVRNAGTGAPVSDVVVNDAAVGLTGGAAVTIRSVLPDRADWSCSALPSTTLECTLPAGSLPAGESRYFDVVLDPSAGGFENCANANATPAPGEDGARVEACAKGGSSNIKVEKTGEKVCRLGEPCTFGFKFTNAAAIGFSGPVRIGDALGVDGFGAVTGATVSVSPPLGCSPEPTTLPINCIATMTLGAGQSRVHTVTVTLPDGGGLADEVGDNGATGKNCVMVIGADVDVNDKRAVAEGLGDRGEAADYYSCVTFRVHGEPEVNQCSAGMVQNNDGKCVCPQGTSFRNGQCRGDQGTTPPPVVTPQSCRIRGQSLNNRGQCACPSGQRVIRGACRVPPSTKPPVVTPQSCRVKGQTRNARGQCSCPKGQRVIGGACRVPPVTKPPVVTPQSCRVKGQSRNARGQCSCPKGQRVIGGACRVPARTLPTRPPSIKVPTRPRACKANEVRIRGNCVPRRVITPRLKVQPQQRVQPQLNLRPQTNRPQRRN
ncbi:hypothetical protein MNBD_ALPHA09-1908 [hydrothermal vent metagenome]|uniref:DUF7929 domain-containing protein n=1 Tax=hydrothermal vent metagenome TaxID=652676 RepID=A0A3B0U8G4_9ZZZZ